jgi:hypothetical protein
VRSRSWERSKCRYARAQRQWGIACINRKEFREAIEHFQVTTGAVGGASGLSALFDGCGA